MFCLYGLTIQKLQGIIAFLRRKNKIKTKIGFNATYILGNVLESYLYIFITQGLGLEEKSVTSCAH